MLKRLAEEKKNYCRLIEDFSFNHFDVKKRLEKIRGEHKGIYISNLTSKKMLYIVIMLSSPQGLDKLRLLVSNLRSSTYKYKEFLSAVQKYGTSLKDLEEALGYYEPDTFKTKV